MTGTRIVTFLGSAAVVPLTALAIAGCGGSSSSNNNVSASAAHPTNASGRAATVGVASSSLGKILVDSHGRTLYLFRKDNGTRSACFGACASAWPPLTTTGKPTVGRGANTSRITTVKRSAGSPQVVYNGHPLYRFSGDQQVGDTNGQGSTAFGAGWFVLSPAGNQISAKAAMTSGGSNGY
jgi:predicted lipoprotein with Yx(FWY)xxD motif